MSTREPGGGQEAEGRESHEGGHVDDEAKLHGGNVDETKGDVQSDAQEGDARESDAQDEKEREQRYLDELKINGGSLDEARLSERHLKEEAKHNGSDFDKTSLDTMSHSEAELDERNLDEAKLNEGKPNKAELDGREEPDEAKIDGANLSEVKPSDAKLNGGKRSEVKSSEAKPRGGKRSGEKLNGGKLDQGNLDEEKLDGAKPGKARPGDAKLNDPKSLERRFNKTMANDVKPNEANSHKRLAELLLLFKLPTLARELVTRLVADGHGAMLPSLLEVLEMEADDRNGRRIDRLRRLSRLPAKTLETLDLGRLPRPLVDKLLELARGEFVERGVNVLCFGLPGTGKSHAACALGHALVKAGHSVLFTPTYQLVQELLGAKRALSLPRALHKLDVYDLVILDDIGYVAQSPEEAEVLFTLMAERYERKSMLITSNLVFSQWDRIFGNPMATAAAIDRLVHHSVILEFDVPSYRTEGAKKGATAAKAAPKATTTAEDNS